jgi:hypothetical protein
MGGHDFRDDREADAGPRGLGGVEGLEDVSDRRLRNA